MSELKAMAIVGAGIVLLSAVANGDLLALHAGGAALTLSLCFTATIASLALTRVTKHYSAREERKKREEILLR